MEENEVLEPSTVAEELPADQPDAFLSGWEGAAEPPAPAEESETEADTGAKAASEVNAAERTAPPTPDVKRQDLEAKNRRDIGEFAATFPEVYEQAKTDKSVIPDGVWKDVAGGIPLAAAYAKNTVIQAAHAVKAAKEAARAAEERARVAQLNQRNTQRATGSMRSAGGDLKNKDPFLDGWDD